jgi:hypothetical protein
MRLSASLIAFPVFPSNKVSYRRQELQHLVNRIVVMTPGSIEGDDGRQELLKAIRSLTVFLKEK